FENGAAVTSLTETVSPNKRKRGTRVKFWADGSFFDTPKFNVKQLKHNLKAKAVLAAGLTIEFVDDINNEKVVWQFTDGVVEYLNEQLDGLETLPAAPFYYNHEAKAGERAAITFALSWLPDGGTPIQESYVNLIPTAQGGTHVNGLRIGILEARSEFSAIYILLPLIVNLIDVFDN